jgi:hypothetical protein
MAKTRTSGITVNDDGSRIVNKQVLGETIFHRLGVVSQDEAEKWLATATERIRLEKSRGTRPRVTFREGAVRYLKESAGLASIDDAAWHIELLDPWVSDLAMDEVCDETLAPFNQHRLEADGVTRTTLNLSLGYVRTILNQAARKW